MDSASDIQVVYTNADGAQTTLSPTVYTVAINSPAPGSLWGVGGFITYPLAGSPIANGTSLTISRILPLTQQTELSNQGNFYPAVVEEGLDTLEMQIQQTAARTGLLRGTWISGVQYNYSDMVVDGANGADTGNIYSCGTANVSGVWATDLANGLWTLALNVQGIVNALPNIGNNQVFGNISGGSTTPTGVGVSALLDSAIGSTQGSILYRSGSAWLTLPPGMAGQFLTTEGTSANPEWSSAAGSGTVTNVATGSGLSGGPITTTGTISLATIANLSLLANLSGGTLAPSATTLSTLLDTVLGNTQGFMIQRGGTVWTATTGFKGVTDGSDASSGQVGEYITSNIVIGSAVSMSSGTTGPITLISLTAGDWDVWANVITNPAVGTTTGTLEVGISTTSSALPTAPANGGNNINSFVSSSGAGFVQGGNCMMRVSIASTTTVYIVALANFSGGSLSAYGSIQARRAR